MTSVKQGRVRQASIAVPVREKPKVRALQRGERIRWWKVPVAERVTVRRRDVKECDGEGVVAKQKIGRTIIVRPQPLCPFC